MPIDKKVEFEKQVLELGYMEAIEIIGNECKEMGQFLKDIWVQHSKLVRNQLTNFHADPESSKDSKIILLLLHKIVKFKKAFTVNY